MTMAVDEGLLDGKEVVQFGMSTPVFGEKDWEAIYCGSQKKSGELGSVHYWMNGQGDQGIVFTHGATMYANLHVSEIYRHKVR